jgi:dUTP pyrophosphatase
MKINVKKLDEKAVIPKYAKEGDAGLDLVATSKDENAMYIEYGTSLAVELPEGYVGLLYPRSSISKYHLSLANSVGVVDSGFRGEIRLRFKKTSTSIIETTYNIGDKVGQLIVMPYPKIELVEVAELGNTERGEGGFGSSGK